MCAKFFKVSHLLVLIHKAGMLQYKLRTSFIETLINKIGRTSGQDDGIGKHSLPTHTTILKLRLNYRTTITHTHQKLS